MIISLEEAKQYLKVDYEDEDILITTLIETAEQYLFNATGIKYDSSNKLAVLYCKALIYDWYKSRGLNQDSSKNMNILEKTRFTLQSILLQLKLGDSNGN